MNQSTVRIGIIGGTGLDEAFAQDQGESVELDTPFGKPAGPILRIRRRKVELAILKRHGPGHRFPPHKVPFQANIFAMKLLGVTHIIATGATGSLREEIRPGDLVIVDQVIDRTFRRPGTFFDHAAVHVELPSPFCPVMRRWLINAGHRLFAGVPESEARPRIHEQGTYVCMEGPQFSTRAESLMHRQWGGDLIGMTAMPEAKLAREAEIAYALIGLPTDYDCWREAGHASAGADEASILSMVIANLERAANASLRLIDEAISDIHPLQAEPSPAHDALKMAIWTARDRIDEDEKRRLAPLWGRWLES
ncbi:MAG: MTAP family purine nucleoside phosphorylase [Phycisphaeraceae bacterium]|nr:MTAP family purine nucleoside phosphorylase [Phycisphaeraceae bacterium]